MPPALAPLTFDTPPPPREVWSYRAGDYRCGWRVAAADAVRLYRFLLVATLLFGCPLAVLSVAAGILPGSRTLPTAGPFVFALILTLPLYLMLYVAFGLLPRAVSTSFYNRARLVLTEEDLRVCVPREGWEECAFRLSLSRAEVRHLDVVVKPGKVLFRADGEWVRFSAEGYGGGIPLMLVTPPGAEVASLIPALEAVLERRGVPHTVTHR